MSPGLRLREPLSPQEPDSLTGYRPANTAGVTAADTVSAASRAANSTMPVTEFPALPVSTGVTVRFDVPRWVLGGFLLFGLCMLGTGVWYVSSGYRPGPSSQFSKLSAGAETPGGNRLDLQVSRRGNDLLINLDRNLQTTIGARHGMLQITDCNEPRYIVLSPSDLTSGQVLYAPRSQDIEIQLTAVTESTSLHETIRVIQPNASPVAYTTRPVPLAKPQTAQPTSRSAADATTHSPAQPPAVTDSGNTTSMRERSGDRVRQFILPRPVSRAYNQQPPGTIRLEATNPPAVAAAPPPLSELSGEITAVRPIQTAPPQPLAQPQPPAQPQPAAERSASAGTRVVDFRPPVPTRQVTPAIPDTIKRMLVRDTSVSVKLRIDAAGNVLSAQAENGSGVTGLLTTIAEATARSWRFRPATADGKPTSADYTLTFLFRR